MRLLMFMNFFSLDLYTYNLNISKMLLTKTLLFSIKLFLPTKSRIQEIATRGIKVGNSKVLLIRSYYKIWEIVFH